MAIIACFVAGLCLGDFPVGPGAVLASLLGRGNETVQMVVWEWRLPRTGLAVLIGAALGLSGAIFQSLMRNPLGSPDIIGFDAGAFAGATILLTAGGSFVTVAAGALSGGILTALLVYALAWKRGVQGLRLILIGIGVGQLLFALSQWLLLRADPETAVTVSIWGSGSLNGVETDRLLSSLVACAVLVPLALSLTRLLRQLELGDDLAQASGLAVEPARRVLILAGTSLSAMATAVVGPIAFVALVAPQLGRKLTANAGVAPVISMLMGAGLLSICDLFAQHGLGDSQLPVGVVTLCFGGLWFVWLLACQKGEYS